MSVLPRRFRVLPLPDDVLSVLYEIWVRQMYERFVLGCLARRRAARHIQHVWDLHYYGEMPDLIEIGVDEATPLVWHNPWLAMPEWYFTNGTMEEVD